MKLDKWAARIHNWKKRKRHEEPMETHILHLHAEVSELWETWRDNGLDRYQRDAHSKPYGFGPELADVVLTALYIAELAGIDLEEEMESVMSFKEQTRARMISEAKKIDRRKKR